MRVADALQKLSQQDTLRQALQKPSQHGETSTNRALEKGMPSIEALAFVLGNCRKERTLVHALRLHGYMHRIGLESHASLGNELVLMLVEVESMCRAQDVFDILVHPNEFSWNGLIAGCLRDGELQQAFILHQKIQDDNSLFLCPHTYVGLLKACGKLKDLEKGCQIHAEIASKGQLERDSYVGSCLVDMYVKCGSLAKAKDSFDKLLIRNVVVWTALMAGHVECGSIVDAFHCFEQMQREGVSPDAVTLVCCLKACGIMRDKDKGQDIHTEIVEKGLEGDALVGSALVDMYAKCGLLQKAQEVFDKLVVQSVVSWNALITGFVEDGWNMEALKCVEKMQSKNISPDDVTFVCSLKAIGSTGDKMKGLEIHTEIVKRGLEGCLFLGNTLVDMYGKCDSLGEAQAVFEKLRSQTVVSWNALIAGYIEHGCVELALDCLDQMQNECIAPNDVTFICGLKACGIMGAMDKGREIHAEIARMRLETDLVVGSTLVDTYAKFGLLVNAEEVFDKLAVRNAVSWNALLAGYVEHEHSEDALHCFECMQCEGICPHTATFVCSLKACGSLGATKRGREIHSMIAKRGLDEDLFIGNTLVDMYAKCGTLQDAQVVYDKLLGQDEVSCNTLITGYAQLGETKNVFHMFARMIRKDIKPNLVTLLNVLNACSHAGLVDQGWVFFELLRNEFGFVPRIEHYTCMVDLFGRAGHFEKAVGLIEVMPIHPGTVVWHTILGACRKWGNVDLGRYAFEHTVRLDDKDAAAYICMFNIFMDANMPEEANEVETMRVQNQAWTKDECNDTLGNSVPSFGWG